MLVKLWNPNPIRLTSSAPGRDGRDTPAAWNSSLQGLARLQQFE